MTFQHLHRIYSSFINNYSLVNNEFPFDWIFCSVFKIGIRTLSVRVWLFKDWVADLPLQGSSSSILGLFLLSSILQKNRIPCVTIQILVFATNVKRRAAVTHHFAVRGRRISPTINTKSTAS